MCAENRNHHVLLKIFSQLTKEETNYLADSLSKIKGFKFLIKTIITINGA